MSFCEAEMGLKQIWLRVCNERKKMVEEKEEEEEGERERGREKYWALV